MTLKEATLILNKIGYGYTDRWKETTEGNIEAEGMRLSGPQAIVEAEYWAAFTVKIKSEKKECGVSFSTDEINTGVPELLDRIDALERKEIAAVNEIRRLLLSRSEAIATRDNARARLESIEGERMETTPAFLRLATYLRRLPRVGLECLVGSGGEDLRCWSDGGWCDGVILACGGDDIDPFVDGEHVGGDFDALRRVFGAERLAGACKRVCRAALGAAGERSEG